MTAKTVTATHMGANRSEAPTPGEFVRQLKRLLKQGSPWDVAAYYDQFGAAVGPRLTERQRTAVGNIMHIVDTATDWMPPSNGRGAVIVAD
jgi:hypothetical protein